MSAKERLRARQSTYVAYEVLEPLPSLSRSSRATSRSGLGNASGRRSTPCTTEKIAVFAPIPRARLSIARAQPAGESGDSKEHQPRGGEGRRVGRAHAEEKRGQTPRRGKCPRHAGEQP